MTASSDLVAKLQYTGEHGLFKAVEDGKYVQPEEAAAAILALEADKVALVEALKELRSLVGIMFGRGPDCIIPETIGTPLGVPIRIGAMIRDTDATLAKQWRPQ